ncbi:hypothetical protein [Zhihengliuella halotolerans]|uniref:Uncharacterized protein n=1 Tax=Zhihengliuella halotolerans TaxID=370736 RepID=A0A4Q8AAF6_9MICC|nr:hypothetical protein [Zhihengliuella halotolerans]RZU60515.1 hypothetical protein EV380_0046 [Zhihengliuella halotolerans]
MKIRQLVTLAAAAAAALLLASCAGPDSSSADGPDRDTPSGSPGCTAESLPIEFGEPIDDAPDSPRRFDFGPATAECHLSELAEFAFLDADEAVIGSPSAFNGDAGLVAATVESDQRVSIELSMRAADDVEAESCDPVVPVYLGHRFPDDAEYSLMELGGDGWKACASEDQELLEVGPYRIQ